LPPGIIMVYVHYIIVSTKGHTLPDFPLKGYASHSGRLDIIARSIVALFNKPRANRKLTLILLGPPSLPLIATIDGASLRNSLWSENDGLNILLKALRGESAEYLEIVRSANPISWLTDFLKKRHNCVKVYLSEKGDDIHQKISVLRNSRCILVLLGAKEDPPSEYARVFLEENGYMLKLGPRSYLTSHCIVYLEYLLGLYKSTDG